MTQHQVADQEMELRGAAAGELRRLRALIREIAGVYVSRLEGRIEQLVDMVRHVQELEGLGTVERQRLLKGICEVSQSLKVKPEKGRRRDLKRIETLLKEVGRLFEGG